MRKIEGIGIGLRRGVAGELLALDTAGPDWLELTPENWMFHGGKARRTLDACAERWPLVAHSVSLSIGGLDPLDATFLDAIETLTRRLDAPWWSDHICFSSIDGAQMNDLLPLPFTEEAIDVVVARAEDVRRRVGTRLALENVTFYSHMPGATMDEAAFLSSILERSDSPLLLDVNNVFVNGKNHGSDPRALLDRIPLDRVVEIHLAGHTQGQEAIVDSHVGPVIDEVWSLYRYVLRRARRPIPTLIEWDSEIPSLEALLDEVTRARAHAETALA